MTGPRHTFDWTPGRPHGAAAKGLAEGLEPLVNDRASSAEDLVREASEILIPWLADREPEWSWSQARATLDDELADLSLSQGWRGPVACWLEALRHTVALGLAAELEGPPREVLAEELGLWLGGDGAGEEPWDGEPLAAGRRLPDRAHCAEAALVDLECGEVIVAHGWSETVAGALEEAQGRGLSPEVVLSEGGPDLGGRRMARRLAPSGTKLRMVYDAALLDALACADRVWVGTEAIGARALLARVGTRALLVEARRREVPSAVLATSDKLMARGELRLPQWCERASWLLWEDPPEGIDLESQVFETVSLDLPDSFATEQGRLSAAELSLRSLRTETQAPV